MNLINSVKTQRVSKKTYSPVTREVVICPDGKKQFRPFSNVPIIGTASDFSLENQIKTGVRFDAPTGDFFKQNRLVVSDIVQNGGEYLLTVTPEPTQEPTQESTQEPTQEPTQESAKS